MSHRISAHSGAMIAFVSLLAAAGCAHCRSASEQRFFDQIGSMSITVYLTYVRNGAAHEFDMPSADRITAFLTERKLAVAIRSAQEPTLPETVSPRQSSAWKQSSAALAEFVKAHPFSTDYACVMEILRGSQTAPVGAIHCYVVDAAGNVCFGVGLNSHHKEFQKHNPRSVEDATSAMIEAMERALVAKRQ